jgi:hypothetical protein
MVCSADPVGLIVWARFHWADGHGIRRAGRRFTEEGNEIERLDVRRILLAF